MSLSTSYLARKLLILTQAPYLDAGVLRLTRVVYLTYINMIDCCVYVFTARWIILNLPTKTSKSCPWQTKADLSRTWQLDSHDRRTCHLRLPILIQVSYD